MNGVEQACSVIKKVFQDIWNYIEPKMTTQQINDYCNERIEYYGAKSACYRYPGDICPFPGHVCISINEEVCHGVPSSRKVETGDIISIDICVFYKGYYGDSCITFILGKALKPEHLQLVKAGYEVMQAAIAAVKPGVHIGTLGHIMQKTAHKLKYDVIYDFAGHYIGKKLHMNPLIPFSGEMNQGPIIKEGDFFTIEPMITSGTHHLIVHKDKWTHSTIDKSMTCQFEHCIQVTKNGCRILSRNHIDENLNFICYK